MKLFLISLSSSGASGTVVAAVVAAESADQARGMDPATGEPIADWDEVMMHWAARPEEVDVRYLGEAAEGVEQGVICAQIDDR